MSIATWNRQKVGVWSRDDIPFPPESLGFGSRNPVLGPPLIVHDTSSEELRDMSLKLDEKRPTKNIIASDSYDRSVILSSDEAASCLIADN